MAAVVRKKQDDKYLQVLRELVSNGGGNRQCFDCGQKGPTYVNMTIGSFVCTRCSGVLRGLTPPHRVKSISMATFTQDDVDYLKNHGNGECAKTWLGLWDPKRAVHQDQRELMIDKYERKRYYLEPASPLKSLTNAVSLKSGSTAAGAGTGAEVPTTSGAKAAAIAGTTSTTASSGSNAFKSIVDDHTELLQVVNGFGHNTKPQYRQQSANAERSFQLTPPSTQRTTMNGLHKAVTGATGSTSNSGKATSAISRPQHQQNGYSHLQEAFMQTCSKTMNNNAVNNNNNELNVLHMTTSRMSDSSSATSINGFGADAAFVADFGSANIFDATMVNYNQTSSPTKLNRSGGAISSNGYAKIQPLKRQQQQQQCHLLNAHGQTNGTSSQSESIGNATSENFADFEHAPIFNAVGLPIPNNNSRSMNTQQRNSQNNKNNNALSSTPSEDRYAALKDLDEQLRESKAAATVATAYGADTFGHNGICNAVNPFKHQQVNPFQVATHGTSPTATQSYFGQMTVISNGNSISSQQPTTDPQFYNYSNGYVNATTTAGTATVKATGPSGCGFSLGALQPTAIVATGDGGGGAFNNPFAATGAMNSNNPFL